MEQVLHDLELPLGHSTNQLRLSVRETDTDHVYGPGEVNLSATAMPARAMDSYQKSWLIRPFGAL